MYSQNCWYIWDIVGSICVILECRRIFLRTHIQIAGSKLSLVEGVSYVSYESYDLIYELTA